MKDVFGKGITVGDYVVRIYNPKVCRITNIFKTGIGHYAYGEMPGDQNFHVLSYLCFLSSDDVMLITEEEATIYVLKDCL